MINISPSEIERKLVEFMKGKSLRQAAKEIGMSHTYLSDILGGRRAITCPPILKKFGLTKITRIEKKTP